jgi:hypothetical protein
MMIKLGHTKELKMHRGDRLTDVIFLMLMEGLI